MVSWNEIETTFTDIQTYCDGSEFPAAVPAATRSVISNEGAVTPCAVEQQQQQQQRQHKQGELQEQQLQNGAHLVLSRLQQQQPQQQPDGCRRATQQQQRQRLQQQVSFGSQLCYTPAELQQLQQPTTASTRLQWPQYSRCRPLSWCLVLLPLLLLASAASAALVDIQLVDPLIERSADVRWQWGLAQTVNATTVSYLYWERVPVSGTTGSACKR